MELISHPSTRFTEEIITVDVPQYKSRNLLLVLFVLIHVPLALLMIQYAQVSTFHAYAALFVGAVSCIFGRLDIAAAAAAYISGAEVLWRMTEASVFWEFGKYATLSICVIGIFRTGFRNVSLPFLYFFLLIPSAILTAEAVSVATLRRELSFNLSGPLTLAISACFFSGLRFNKRQFGRILFALVAPITAIVTIAISSTMSAPDIYFSDESNQITSGGYGPNQVSAMLGLGALAMMLFVLVVKSHKILKVIAAVIGTVLLVQSLLTFSRGGAYMAALGIVTAGLMLVHQPRRFIALVLGIFVFAGVFAVAILPWLNSFTGGSLTKRYTDFGTTGRVEIVEDDFRIWNEHPLMGVGPGQASEYRYLYHRGAPAHTEFSRMLAEHGILGLAAILVLVALAFRNFRSAKLSEGKAITVSLILWSIAFMFINAMRLAAPSFLFGLTSAQFHDDDEVKEMEIESEDAA